MSNGCCVYCTSGLCMANAALVYISRHRIMAGNGGGVRRDQGLDTPL